MWDRPDILNSVATTLYAVAAALACYAGVLTVVHLPLFPLREVRVVDVPAHVTAEQVETIVRRDLRGNFFTIDLATARTAFESLPWVRRVQVRRLWPDRLDIAVEEHVALAQWTDGALVSVRGEVFRGSYDGQLPIFSGPEGTAKEIAIQYEYFRRSLATIGHAPAQVHVSPRRAWQVKLASGTTLELGREQVEERMARFVTTYPRSLAGLGRRLEYVDLRYANGYAVRIPELRPERRPEKQQKRRRGT